LTHRLIEEHSDVEIVAAHDPVVKTFSDTHITEPIRELINRATPAVTQDKLCE
jgi:hypothetical protein